MPLQKNNQESIDCSCSTPKKYPEYSSTPQLQCWKHSCVNSPLRGLRQTFRVVFAGTKNTPIRHNSRIFGLKTIQKQPVEDWSCQRTRLQKNDTILRNVLKRRMSTNIHLASKTICHIAPVAGKGHVCRKKFSTTTTLFFFQSFVTEKGSRSRA